MPPTLRSSAASHQVAMLAVKHEHAVLIVHRAAQPDDAGGRARRMLVDGRCYGCASIGTSSVIFFQRSISLASQVLASSSDVVGTRLKFCLANVAATAGVCIASVIALRSVSSTSVGVPAGANSPCHASVPTPSKPASCMVGTFG